MDPNAVLLANGSVRIKQTRHGPMAYNINDMYIGRSLDCYGEYSRGEDQLFAQLAPPGGLALDVGANIGALTLPLARIVGARGAVVAFEPQRAVYQLLCTNLALNEINNVRAIHAAAGQAAGRTFVPVFDHSKPGNFGGIELNDQGGEPVEVMTIDSLQLPACHFIKIDVEGRERSVIAGAAATIARCRPVLYVENDRRQQSPELIRQICDLNYTCYWHLPPLYAPDNFYGNATNVFPGIVSIDMMCLPKGDGRSVEGMKPVAGPDDWPFPY
jgi:FkbM family methyltransferase